MTGRVCIIGAGVAGLACARRLADAGVATVVLEKSRGIGGRLATRRTRGGPTFDHGAQYVTAKGEAFSTYLHDQVTAGAAQAWEAVSSAAGAHDRFVGVATMPDMVRSLSAGLDIIFETAVIGVQAGDHGWEVQVDGAEPWVGFTHVLSTAPAEQSAALIEPHCSFDEAFGRVAYDACMAAMIGFEAPIGLDAHSARDVSERIAWVARNSSKPGRDFAGEQWVVHAPPAWSAQHLDSEKDAIATELFDAFVAWAAPKAVPEPTWLMGHRWKYAQVNQAVDRPCLFDAATGLGAAGDWCIGARVEAAYDSGVALADAVIG